MPSVERPWRTSKLLIDRVLNSILLYAAPVWGKTLQIAANAGKLSAVYRMITQTLCSTFRVVSDHGVISGMKPIDILTDYMTNIYNVKCISPLSQAKNAERGACK